MEAWQDRVIAEKRELDEKVVKLAQFISNTAALEKLPDEDGNLLRVQLYTMREYSEILARRIERFK